MPFLRECPDVPNNAIKYYDVATGMVGKVDFLLNGKYNISRSAIGISEVRKALSACLRKASTGYSDNSNRMCTRT